jgi:hypothetical protein
MRGLVGVIVFFTVPFFAGYWIDEPTGRWLATTGLLLTLLIICLWGYACYKIFDR